MSSTSFTCSINYRPTSTSKTFSTNFTIYSDSSTPHWTKPTGSTEEPSNWVLDYDSVEFTCDVYTNSQHSVVINTKINHCYWEPSLSNSNGTLYLSIDRTDSSNFQANTTYYAVITGTFYIDNTWNYKSKPIKRIDDNNYWRFNCNINDSSFYGIDSSAALCQKLIDLETQASAIAQNNNYQTGFLKNSTDIFLSNFDAYEIKSLNPSAMDLYYNVWRKTSGGNKDKIIRRCAGFQWDNDYSNVYMPCAEDFIYDVWCSAGDRSNDFYVVTNRDGTTEINENNPIVFDSTDSGSPLYHSNFAGEDYPASLLTTFKAKVREQVSFNSNSYCAIEWNHTGEDGCTIKLNITNGYSTPIGTENKNLVIRVRYYAADSKWHICGTGTFSGTAARWNSSGNISFTGSITEQYGGLSATANSTTGGWFKVEVEYHNTTYGVEQTFSDVSQSVINNIPIFIKSNFTGYSTTISGNKYSGAVLFTDSSAVAMEEDIISNSTPATVYLVYPQDILLGYVKRTTSNSFLGYYGLKRITIDRPRSYTLQTTYTGTWSTFGLAGHTENFSISAGVYEYTISLNYSAFVSELLTSNESCYFSSNLDDSTWVGDATGSTISSTGNAAAILAAHIELSGTAWQTTTAWIKSITIDNNKNSDGTLYSQSYQGNFEAPNITIVIHRESNTSTNNYRFKFDSTVDSALNSYKLSGSYYTVADLTS